MYIYNVNRLNLCTIQAQSEHVGVTRKIESLHHQICTRSIYMGINRVPSSIWRCKNWFCVVATLFWNRGSFYTLVQSVGDFWYTPCIPILLMQFIWYPFQWYWCRSGGVVTGFLFSLAKIWSSHLQNCTGFIGMGINQILPPIWRCKDWFWAMSSVVLR